jgi:uncharacterized protein (DUF2235 family)
MPKNLVICCDGTNNQFGRENTNVVRLVQALNRDPARQRMYYDPGVGTLPEPGWVTWIGKLVSDVCGLAFGAGLLWKVQEAYAFLMELWEPGDQVFCFGFSRGAYTVRVLAGLLHELGLLSRGNDNLIPYVTRLFKTARKDNPLAPAAEPKSAYWQLRDEFRRTFARKVHPEQSDDDRRFPVRFVGLWDTVSSVGWVWDPAKFPFSTHNPGIQTVRHAVSVDERRWFFRQNLMQPVNGQDVIQLWFPGVHCDVGGGYPPSGGGLWRNAFQWLVGEARGAGLLIDAQRLDAVLNQPQPAPSAPWSEPQHESLNLAWWPAEFFPKLCRAPGATLPLPRLGLGRHRFIPDGQLLHRSTLLRLRETDYAPPNISDRFRQEARQLPSVPEESMAYRA